MAVLLIAIERNLGNVDLKKKGKNGANFKPLIRKTGCYSLVYTAVALCCRAVTISHEVDPSHSALGVHGEETTGCATSLHEVLRHLNVVVTSQGLASLLKHFLVIIIFSECSVVHQITFGIVWVIAQFRTTEQTVAPFRVAHDRTLAV